jgi:hypothetical protein
MSVKWVRVAPEFLVHPNEMLGNRSRKSAAHHPNETGAFRTMKM